jgi:hypothetical protein
MAKRINYHPKYALFAFRCVQVEMIDALKVRWRGRASPRSEAADPGSSAARTSAGPGVVSEKLYESREEEMIVHEGNTTLLTMQIISVLFRFDSCRKRSSRPAPAVS